MLNRATTVLWCCLQTMRRKKEPLQRKTAAISCHVIHEGSPPCWAIQKLTVSWTVFWVITKVYNIYYMIDKDVGNNLSERPEGSLRVQAEEPLVQVAVTREIIIHSQSVEQFTHVEELCDQPSWNIFTFIRYFVLVENLNGGSQSYFRNGPYLSKICLCHSSPPEETIMSLPLEND